MKNNRCIAAFKRFMDGEVSFEPKKKEAETRRESNHNEKSIAERYAVWHNKNGFRVFKGLYVAAGCLIAACIIATLLLTVSYLPPYGEAGNPVNNEVTERYIEKGMEETGAVNIVAGVILDYRAFDTFGESCVLFVAACSVMMLMKKDKKGK